VACGTAWNYDVPIISDPCCSDTNYVIGYIGPVTNGMSPCGQTNSLTFIILDQCGNSNSCTQTVTILNSVTLYPTSVTIPPGSPVPTNPPGFSAGCCSNVILTPIGSVTNITGCGEIIDVQQRISLWSE
jgi:hypothetical protein